MSIEAQNAIRKGSKSFYLASLFFSRSLKEDCWKLYRWCRYCDDVIDAGGTIGDLNSLVLQTKKGLAGEPSEKIFADLGEVCRKHQIPNEYPLELLAGFGKDIEKVFIRSEKELENYAYQVAGVVGLMMSCLMKADLQVAQSAAISLGNAMQLTNIARDVREDFEKGRIYLPQTWLQEAQVESEYLLAQDQRAQVFAVVQRLLQRADDLYVEGLSGLKYLPFRSAVAISIAASIYSQIGRKILNSGPASIDSRVYITLPHKIFLAGVGLIVALSSLTERFLYWRSHAKS